MQVALINVATQQHRQATTDREGGFVIPVLPPGRYRLTATREGFTPLEVPDITLNVNDQVALRLQLKVAVVGEEVSIVAEPSRVNTAPAVSTVIDRKFVETLPMNGRSFQTLLTLVPGVVLSSAGRAAAGTDQRERPARQRQLLHGRRRERQRLRGPGQQRHRPARRRIDTRADHLRRVQRAPVGGRARGVPDPDVDVRRRVRASARRPDLAQHALRHERVPRLRLRVPPQRSAECERLVRQPQRIEEAADAPEPVRRDARRPRRAGPAVLLRQL